MSSDKSCRPWMSNIIVNRKGSLNHKDHRDVSTSSICCLMYINSLQCTFSCVLLATVMVTWHAYLSILTFSCIWFNCFRICMASLSSLSSSCSVAYECLGLIVLIVSTRHNITTHIASDLYVLKCWQPFRQTWQAHVVSIRHTCSGYGMHWSVDSL